MSQIIMGPFDGEREARAAAHAIVPPRPGWSILSQAQNRQLLSNACADTDIALGAYDQRVLAWLAGYEDSACAVVAGMIRRAFEAAREAGADDPDDGIVQTAPIDSEPWACVRCGAVAIGRRPAGDRCLDCRAEGRHDRG